MGGFSRRICDFGFCLGLRAISGFFSILARFGLGLIFGANSGEFRVFFWAVGLFDISVFGSGAISGCDFRP